jgi:hypothetical protein
MPRSRISILLPLSVLAVLSSWTTPAWADVAYTEVLRVPESRQDPLHSSQSHIFLTDDAIRKETLPRQKSTPRIQASIIPNIEGLLPRIEVIRTDTNLAWNISPNGQIRSGRLRQVLLASEPIAEPANLRALANLESELDRTVLRRTGFKKKINGYVCEHLFATVTSDVRDRRTGEKGTLVLMSDLWVATDAPGAREIRKFHASLGRLLGLEEFFCQDAALIMDAIPDQAVKLAELVKQVKGLPVSNTFTAKLRKSSRGGATRTELLYSLKSDLISLKTVRPDPRRFEPPLAVATR